MNKRLFLIVGGVLFLLILVITMIPIYDNYLLKQQDLDDPSLFTRYSDSGYYKIDPETILTSLETGQTEVFTSLLENPDEIEPVTSVPIRWTQTDFLKIASALGQFAWGDPMNLKDWNVRYISFVGSCDDPIGFNFASITYFKTRTTGYATRLIEMHPAFGWVRWGNGKTYPEPILQKWNKVDLLNAKVNADNALQIASEDAKKHFQFKDGCGVSISAPQYNDPKNWYLHFIGAPDAIAYAVNLETGDYTFQNLSK